jgi:hypothetical protein
MKYDPMTAPDPAEWLDLSEDERIHVVLEHHRRARVKLPNETLHAAFHAVIETQVAMGDELPVARTLARLEAEGLDRHDAIHAISSALVAHFQSVMGGERKGADAYYAEVEKLTAEGWRASADDADRDDDEPPRAGR